MHIGLKQVCYFLHFLSRTEQNETFSVQGFHVIVEQTPLQHLLRQQFKQPESHKEEVLLEKRLLLSSPTHI